MSKLRRDIYRKKLRDFLRAARDEAFLIMCWATNAIQSGREDAARDLFSFPPDAVTKDLSSRLSVHPWKIETLVNELLITPKTKIIPGRPDRILNCSAFSTMVAVSNALRKLENADDGITLARVNVLREMHRLGQRQFEWQRGFISKAQLYRAGFLYNGSLTRDFFANKNGFSIDEFMQACFAFRALYFRRPSVTVIGGADNIGLREELLQAVLRLISVPHADAIKIATELSSGGGHIGYRPSILRTYPCIRFTSGLTISPLPDLIMLRCTSGIFYDVASAEQGVKNEISGRFERYCFEYMREMLPTMHVSEAFKYAIKKGNTLDTPDVLIYEEGQLSVIAECKATRMSYRARFSEDPLTDDSRGYGEMVRGVFQIWRFASHLRRGVLPNEKFKPGLCGVILTLDTWLSMANEMQREIFTLARKMAAERDAEILDHDCIPVAFCTIDDLEDTLGVATPSSFLAAIRAAAGDVRFEGWMLWNVHREVASAVNEDNDHPFAERIGEVLPWWSRLGNNKEGLSRLPEA